MNWIKARRLALNMTQAELAKQIGTTQTVVSLVEKEDVLPNNSLKRKLNSVLFGEEPTTDRKMTQNVRVLEHMRKYGSITQRDAVEFGCYRLSARIHDLRRMGYTIKTEKLPFNNGYGSGHYGMYTLVEAEQ